MPVTPFPPIDTDVSDPPNRGQAQAVFSPKMDAMLGSLQPLVDEQNALGAWMETTANSTEDWANDAEVSATASEASRQAADAALADAESAAAAAQLAAGFPTDPNFGSVFRSEGVANLKTANFAAVVGRVYDCDTSAGAFTVTLPVSLSIGDWIGLRDISGTWSLHNLTVNRNGHNIFGEAANEILDMSQSTVFLEYRGATPGVIY